MEQSTISSTVDMLAKGLSDPTGTSEVWQQVWREVRRLGHQASGQGLSAGDLEEISWEAVEQALADMDKWNPAKSSEETFLAACAVARIPTIMRSRQRAQRRLGLVVKELAKHYTDEEVIEQLNDFEELVAPVSNTDRIALELWADGWSHKDIAAHLGISEATSRQRVWRARQALGGEQ